MILQAFFKKENPVNSVNPVKKRKPKTCQTGVSVGCAVRSPKPNRRGSIPRAPAKQTILRNRRYFVTQW